MDYDLIAKTLNARQEMELRDGKLAVLDVAIALSKAFKAKDPDFNAKRFLIKCGLDKDSRAVLEA